MQERFKWYALIAAIALVVGCGVHGPRGDFDDDDDDGSGGAGLTGEGLLGSSGEGLFGSSGEGAGDTSSSGTGGTSTSSGTGGSSSTSSSTSTGSSGTGGSSSTSSSTSSSGTGGTGTGGSGGVGGGGCYTEGYDLGISLNDLQSSYSGSQWLPTMLAVLSRRYSNGWYVMDQMKNDPWLTSSFPGYFNLGSWAGMIESIDTACHEETHGYDFDQALSYSGQHVYYMGSNLEIVAAKLNFFARNQIYSEVTQGGSVTSMYDSTYLTGTQGSYDFIFLADELTAYINGLACATTVGDHLSQGGSFRDGAAAHLYYLQAYLRVARTQHPSLYNQWKADPDWQQFVRFSWARGHFWTDVSAQFSQLGINDAAIWNRVNDPNNLAEIQQFTGDTPTVVACTP